MKTQINVLCLLFLMGLAITVTAQDQPIPIPPTPEYPIGPTTIMEFEETVYEFGMIEEGTIVSQVFTFTNTGDEPLIISNAKGSCGCTVPQWPREPLMPGETASLTVEFNSKGKKGKRSQKVTITANTYPPQTFLYLNGEIIPKDGESDLSNFLVVPDKEETPELPQILREETDVEIDLNCFAIYPNPTAEILNLEMEENQLGQSAIFAIYNKSGQLMAERKVEVIKGNIEFNVGHYPAGTYYIQTQIGKSKPQIKCFVKVE